MFQNWFVFVPKRIFANQSRPLNECDKKKMAKEVEISESSLRRPRGNAFVHNPQTPVPATARRLYQVP